MDNESSTYIIRVTTRVWDNLEKIRRRQGLRTIGEAIQFLMDFPEGVFDIVSDLDTVGTKTIEPTGTVGTAEIMSNKKEVKDEREDVQSDI